MNADRRSDAENRCDWSRLSAPIRCSSASSAVKNQLLPYYGFGIATIASHLPSGLTAMREMSVRPAAAKSPTVDHDDAPVRRDSSVDPERAEHVSRPEPDEILRARRQREHVAV